MASTETNTKELFALDLGNKQVKIKNSKKKYRFPSRVLNKHFSKSGRFDSLSTTLKQKLNVYECQRINDDDVFLIGPDIDKLNKDEYVTETIQFGEQRYLDKSFERLVSYAIGILGNDFAEAKKGILEVEVVIGLPTEDFTETIIKTVMKQLARQHTVTINGVTVNVNVDNAYVLPQPIGTLYNELISSKNVVDTALLDKTTGIVDIGGGTILLDSIQNFTFEEIDREQKHTGIYTLYNRIVSNCLETPKPSKFDVEAIIRAGKPYIFSPTENTSIDLTSLIEKEVNIYTEEIIQAAKSTFKDLSKFDFILFTGGGSNIINHELVKSEITNSKFTKDSEFANVIGFYKWLQQKELQV